MKINLYFLCSYVKGTNFFPMHVYRSGWEGVREGDGEDVGLALVPQPVVAFTLAFVALAATTTSTLRR